MAISEQIRSRRKELGISQEELAARIYVSRQTISNWETGRTYPDIESLLLMSALFGSTVDELIKGDVENMKESNASDARKMKVFTIAVALCTLAATVIMLCGFTVWEWGIAPTLISGISLTALAVVPAFEIERLKKKHDILTYAEISSFEKGIDVDRNTPAGLRVRRHPVATEATKILVSALFGAVLGFTFILFVWNVLGWRPL